jgi:hypothetical protein
MPDGSLVEWLTRDLGHRENSPPVESSVELVEQAELAIRRYLGRPKKLRPSAVARELTRLAKKLKGAANAADRLGDQGWLMIAAASGANQEFDESGMVRHILYLERMAAWSQKGVQVANEQSRSAQDYRGGPTPNQRLRQLIAHLLVAYQKILGIRPKLTIDKESHLAEHGFAGFVKQALRHYAPEGLRFSLV